MFKFLTITLNTNENGKFFKLLRMNLKKNIQKEYAEKRRSNFFLHMLRWQSRVVNAFGHCQSKFNYPTIKL